MRKTERLKLILLGLFFIIGGIGILIYNFVFAEIVSLGIIPIGAFAMIVVGYILIRRALARY